MEQRLPGKYFATVARFSRVGYNSEDMIPASIPWRIRIVAALLAALIYWLLVFLDVPETVRGVFLFSNGLPEAVIILYAREDVTSVRGQEAAVPAEIKALGEKFIRIRWFGRKSKLIQEVS